MSGTSEASLSEKDPEGDSRNEITLIMMPFLGGSWTEWKPVMSLLEQQFRCIGLDLPGFGDAAEIPGYSVDDMADYVEAAIAKLVPERFVLVGHSMAGKVAVAVASRAAKNARSTSLLEGVVLVASSPPSPEPMSDSKRAQMIAMLGEAGSEDRDHAAKYIHDNVEEPLPDSIFQGLVAVVLRRNPKAWRAWLESGSREDWASRVAELTVPALIVAGEKDADLGAAAQTKLTLPHLRSARLEIVRGAKHLIPVEQPALLAALIAEFVAGLSGPKATLPESQHESLVYSYRVSPLTRDVLLRRAKADDSRYVPSILSSVEMTTLRAIADQVVPLKERAMDFAQRIDKKLATGAGKGWRYAELPQTAEAWKLGLQTVEAYCRLRYGLPFLALAVGQKQTVLEAAAAGDLEPRLLDKALHPVRATEEQGGPLPLDGSQMQRWFEDVRAELAGIYVSHPSTLAEMGYSGIADGADAKHLSGFVKLGLGETESWEPRTRGEAQA